MDDSHAQCKVLIIHPTKEADIKCETPSTENVEGVESIEG